KSEDEIAAILAHEFVHADRAHGIVQAARNNRLNLLTLAGMIAATQGGGMAAAMLSSAIQTAIMGAYSIELEKEADARGIDIMHKAGYNPAAMLTTMERLQVERMKRAYVDPGIFQTHPEVEERVRAALKYMKDNGIEVDRKDVLHKLTTEVAVKDGRAVLTIDAKTLADLPESKENYAFLSRLGELLDDILALELAPYDVTVHGTHGDQSLIIKGRIILKESEMPEGMPQIPEIRERIVTALADARRENPLADYYE
ncbi:MAG: M48 family metalloprotease, partial [Synergistaceae bacterium]|nr:M48 family metalloprotease [Synergistaceae bacterium]